MQKVLITGGAGFIGSHLVELLLEKNFNIIILDDLSTGKLENLPKDSRITFIEGDVSDKSFIEKVKKQHSQVDYIFHLAAIASVQQSMENPSYTHSVNFDATLNILDVYKNSGVKKFVYASSAAVYGNPKTIPTDENSQKNPLSPYGTDKLSGEYYLKIFNDSFNFPTVSCRFFNVFGERQDPSSPYSGVISIFFNKVLAKKRGEQSSINIYGDGKQVRDFIYVKDIVRGLFFMAESKNIRGEVFNFGYGKSTSINELADEIKSIVCDEIEINHKKGRDGDIQKSKSDILKLKSTGFEFKYDFKIGIRNLRNSFV